MKGGGRAAREDRPESGEGPRRQQHPGLRLRRGGGREEGGLQAEQGEAPCQQAFAVLPCLLPAALFKRPGAAAALQECVCGIHFRNRGRSSTRGAVRRGGRRSLPLIPSLSMCAEARSASLCLSIFRRSLCPSPPGL